MIRKQCMENVYSVIYGVSSMFLSYVSALIWFEQHKLIFVQSKTLTYLQCMFITVQAVKI